MDHFIYALIELAAALIGVVGPKLAELPPPLQVAALVALGWSWTYKRGWNDAGRMVRDSTKRAADEAYKRMRR